MKAINWIREVFWSILAWFALRDGHTVNHYIVNDKSIVKDESGNVKVWKDSSGHGNDAIVYPNANIEIKEIIVRDIGKKGFKGHAIYMALKYKYKVK